MQVEFSPKAFEDLDTIADYVAIDSAAIAVKFINSLIDRCLEIPLAPKGYIERPELGDNVKTLAFKDYLIIYRLASDVIRIERIIHGSRDYLKADFF